MERVLIIKPSSLGDILHALQVVETIRERLGPERVEITWLVRDSFAPLLEVCSSVDRLIIFKRGEGLRGIWRAGMRLRRERFDWVLDMQGLARSAFWALCARAPKKVGRGDGREGSRWFFKELAGAPRAGFKKSHAVDILAEFLPKMGLPKELCGSVKFPRAKLSSALAERLGGDDELVLIFPDSRRAEKEWPYFEALTGLLLKEFPQKKFLWVGQSSRVKADAAWELGGNFLNLMGKTSLEDVLVLISRAELCITNDSGPMHMAAAMKVPVLGIFGPTSPVLYGPFPLESERNRVICAPRGDLSLLPADQVFGELRGILKK